MVQAAAVQPGQSKVTVVAISAGGDDDMRVCGGNGGRIWYNRGSGHCGVVITVTTIDDRETQWWR